jgi:hypothetical protein
MINLVAGEKHRWELAGDNLFVDLDLSRENLQAGQLLSSDNCFSLTATTRSPGLADFLGRDWRAERQLEFP